jgi:hypothetical protein
MIDLALPLSYLPIRTDNARRSRLHARAAEAGDAVSQSVPVSRVEPRKARVVRPGDVPKRWAAREEESPRTTLFETEAVQEDEQAVRAFWPAWLFLNWTEACPIHSRLGQQLQAIIGP